MAWTQEKTISFQTHNDNMLKEINDSLRPDNGLEGKVGIFIPGQVGDCATSMSVLKYRKEIFGNKKIIWFINYPNADLLRYAPISEVRPWLWAGNGLKEGTPDFYPLLCNENNRLNKELAKEYELTADLDDGYFPAPYMLTSKQRHGLNYPNVSKKVFGVDMILPWHPVLTVSDNEYARVKIFMDDLPKGRKNIIFETFAGSGQSKLTHEMVLNAMRICEQGYGGNCNFIFVSHKYLKHQESFPDNFFTDNVFSAAKFMPRVCGQIANYCDLFISVSSGISCVSSCWGNKPVVMLQYCGSAVCGTKELALGKCVQVFSDNKPDLGEKEFYNKLKQILKQ